MSNAVNLDELPAGYKSMVGEMGVEEAVLEQMLYQAINQQYQQHIASENQDQPDIPDAEE